MRAILTRNNIIGTSILRKNQLLRISPQFFQIASFCIGPAKPNPKTLILLQNLPLSLTNETLSQTVQQIETIRKSEVEPGCALHVIDQVKAEFAAQQIRSLNLKANIRPTCLPSVVLHNIPNNITTEALFTAFQQFRPMAIRFSGKGQIIVTVPDATTALVVEKTVKNLENCHFQQSLIKSPDGRYCVHISNFSPSVNLNQALRLVSDAVCKEIPTAVLSASPGTTNVTVRLTPQKHHYLADAQEQLDQALRKIQLTSEQPVTAEVKRMKKPVLFLHNVLGISEEKLRKLCQEDNSAERVQMTWKSKDITGDLAVAYFNSDLEAYQAMKWIKSNKVNDKQIKTSFQTVSEPAVKITGFPDSLTKSKFFQLFSAFKVSRIDVLPRSVDPNSTAVVVLSNQKEVDRMISFINIQNPGGFNMKASDFPIDDYCFEFTFPENITPPIDEIKSALQAANIPIKSISTDTNVSAYIAFETAHQAARSQNGFLSGNIKISPDASTPFPTAYHGGGVISSSVSIFPSYALEVMGVPQDQSAQYVVDQLHDVEVFKAERSATVKFKKHEHVVGGMRALRRLEIDGKRLKPIRNYPIEEEGDPEYDSADLMDKFDHDHYHMMLKDYLSAEPAVRYQMARNYFERSLFSAEGTKDASFLLDEGAPSTLKVETRDLLAARSSLTNRLREFENGRKPIPEDLQSKFDENTSRLFEIFIQREDMLKYSSDFADIESMLGPANNTPGNINEWNNLLLEKREMYVNIDEVLRSFNPNKKQKLELDDKKKIILLDEEGEEGGDEEGKKSGDDETSASGVLEGGVISDEQFLQDGLEKKSYFNVEMSRDHDGHIWNTIIVHEDQTQVVTSGGRVMSFRILLTIGNLKGVGGYGMGKGLTPQLALNSAFRAALNNLIFLDLYENAALAHDLVGKENNCWVYIRATPKERSMVASPLASAIFQSMGIVSCSCKIVGRRQPYAMIRAIFKALGKHKNLDEIAKERGARYLTLKWMYDHGL